MNFYKIPIIEKIYEAYSALADDRVKFENGVWRVSSSDYEKTYTISEENGTYVSNDNMSYWKQTIGYPILAILMLKGEINYNNEIIKNFKNINWKKINIDFNNDYVKSTKFILEELSKNGLDIEFVKSETEKVYQQVKNLKLVYIKSKNYPAK